ncbi:protein kinase domain-containing protein [Streptomyces cavourensis]|uniref:protein kinase domain-containing protein n=1 Tax=Streptomyces cavourensis TaxID=67258 RepID=UPI003976A55C
MWPLDQADPARIGPYRLLARLGEGGMGTVYLAEGGGGERVALKSIRYGFTEDPDFRVRFAREIEAASLVRAGSIARVVAAEPGADGQRPWVATEFIPGLPLQRLVATQGPLPAASAGALAAGLARALEAVHAAGLVHRDVKPSNILLTVEEPRLIDFGVAKLVDASTGGGLTRTGASVGSPGYMSPEQVLGRTLTPAGDVFGLGGVLVFATTGRLPFPVPDSTNQHALMYAVVQDAPSLDGVPDELRPLVAECLAKDPADRPDAPALAARLAPYAALLDGDDSGGSGDGSSGAGAGAADAEPWLPARALVEVARISGRAAAQGEWRPGAGAEAAGSASGPAGPGSGPDGAGAEAAGSPPEPPAAAPHAGKDPSPHAGKAPSADSGNAPSGPPASPEAGKTPSAPPVSPPPPPSAPLAYVPTIAASPGPAPQAAPRPPGSVPPPTPPEHPAAAPHARTPEPTPAPANPARPHYVRQEPSPATPPRPAPSPAWSAQRAVFRSPESLAIALSWLYGVYIAFKCVAVVMHLGFAGDIGDWKEADFALWTDVETLVGKADTLILVDSLLAVAAGVTTLVWFWRVRINAEAFAPREHRYSPGMAIGSWFIPVAGWIIPGKITFDIWYASLQDRHRGRPDEWGWQTTRRWPGRRLLGLWWGWVIVFSVSLSVVFFLPDVMRGAVDYPNAIYFDRMLSAVHWGTFLNLLCIPGVALSIAVVRRLTELQDIRSAGPR